MGDGGWAKAEKVLGEGKLPVILSLLELIPTTPRVNSKLYAKRNRSLNILQNGNNARDEFVYEPCPRKYDIQEFHQTAAGKNMGSSSRANSSFGSSRPSSSCLAN